MKNTLQNFLWFGIISSAFVGIPASLAGGESAYIGLSFLSGGVAATMRDVLREESQDKEEKANTLEQVAKDYQKLPYGYSPEVHSSLLELAEKYRSQ